MVQAPTTSTAAGAAQVPTSTNKKTRLVSIANRFNKAERHKQAKKGEEDDDATMMPALLLALAATILLGAPLILNLVWKTLRKEDLSQEMYRGRRNKHVETGGASAASEHIIPS